MNTKCANHKWEFEAFYGEEIWSCADCDEEIRQYSECDGR